MPFLLLLAQRWCITGERHFAHWPSTRCTAGAGRGTELEDAAPPSGGPAHSKNLQPLRSVAAHAQKGRLWFGPAFLVSTCLAIMPHLHVGGGILLQARRWRASRAGVLSSFCTSVSFYFHNGRTAIPRKARPHTAKLLLAAGNKNNLVLFRKSRGGHTPNLRTPPAQTLLAVGDHHRMLYAWTVEPATTSSIR